MNLNYGPIVSTRKRKLSKSEIKQAFAEGHGTQFPAILTLDQFAALIQYSKKTISEWISKGRLDGAFRRRGKRLLFWRDRVIDIIFNGKDW